MFSNYQTNSYSLSEALEEIEPNFALPRTSGSLDVVNEYTVLQPNVKSDDNCEGMKLPFAFASPIVYGFSFMDKRWRKLLFLSAFRVPISEIAPSYVRR